ncbi:TIGR04222 domain-containing membrane protein [Plantactinospora sonchi]|uniref:TIGR04222 domain-containing membrane protein n=1 Tax=Plantactinospora sonchi TaxID=1544735 RepID=A0ABU7RKA0_9ACTN
MDPLGQPDTWGISGPNFLLLFLSTAALLVVGTLVHRSVRFAGRVPSDLDELHPVQVAWLAGGDQRAVYTALGALRAAGAVGTKPNRRLHRTGPLPTGAGRLEWAVHEATGRQPRTRDLTNDGGVTSALTDLRSGLERDGLALPSSVRRAARTGPLLLLGLLAVGTVRLGEGLAADRPVGFLVTSLVLLLPLCLVLLFAVPRQTRAAKTVLRRMRARYHHLSPVHSPAYATYGVTGAAMGIAVFGTVALFELDLAFAMEAEIQRSAASGAGASAGGGGGGGGDSSASAAGGGDGCGGGGGCGGGCGGCGG